MRKLFLMCQTTGPAETRFLADPLAFWQTHCRCSFAHACGKNGEQWTISRSQEPVMDGCLPDPDKKYPLRSDGPANFAFSGIALSTLCGLQQTSGIWLPPWLTVKDTATCLLRMCAKTLEQYSTVHQELWRTLHVQTVTNSTLVLSNFLVQWI